MMLSNGILVETAGLLSVPYLSEKKAIVNTSTTIVKPKKIFLEELMLRVVDDAMPNMVFIGVTVITPPC